MHPELERLPHFRILSLQDKDSPEYDGVFDSGLRLEDGWHGYLVSDDDATVLGRFYDYDGLKKTAVFKPRIPVDGSPLEIGMSYTYIDGYWGERVALVLDRSKQWNRTRFVPQDAVDYRYGDQRIRGRVGQAPTFPVDDAGTTIKGGWDHEHCDICSEKIGRYGQPYGYASGTSQWVCTKCYSDYVKPVRISFIDELAIAQIRALQ